MATAIATPYRYSPSPAKSSRRANILLWSAQGLLAAMFIFAGGMKLITPLAALEQQAQMSGMFLRFIGICEFLGALGLILPGLTRIRVVLTPLAASGLTIIMIGATVVTIATTGVTMAIMPFVVGVFSALVAIGRWSVTPLRTRAHA